MTLTQQDTVPTRHRLALLFHHEFEANANLSLDSRTTAISYDEIARLGEREQARLNLFRQDEEPDALVLLMRNRLANLHMPVLDRIHKKVRLVTMTAGEQVMFLSTTLSVLFSPESSSANSADALVWLKREYEQGSRSDLDSLVYNSLRYALKSGLLATQCAEFFTMPALFAGLSPETDQQVRERVIKVAQLANYALSEPIDDLDVAALEQVLQHILQKLFADISDDVQKFGSATLLSILAINDHKDVLRKILIIACSPESLTVEKESCMAILHMLLRNPHSIELLASWWREAVQNGVLPQSLSFAWSTTDDAHKNDRFLACVGAEI